MAYDDDYAGIEELTHENAMNMAGNRGEFDMGESPAISLSSNGDSIIEDATEIIDEAKEDDEEKKEEREEKREQTVRVVIDKPKPKKKEKFDADLTDEEKKEYKAMRLDEKRTTLEERKQRLEQRKQKVSDERFRRDVSPEQFGTYRKAKILMGRDGRPQPARAPARAKAEARAWTPTQMMGSIRKVRDAKPYNPVIASQGKRADYMAKRPLSVVAGPASLRSDAGVGPSLARAPSKPMGLQPTRMPHADYFKGFGKKTVQSPKPFKKPSNASALRSPQRPKALLGFGFGKFGHSKKKMKSRWGRSW